MTTDKDADEAAAASRLMSQFRIDQNVILASIFLLRIGVGKKSNTKIQDIVRKYEIDLDDILDDSNLPPDGASEPYRRLIHKHHDLMISTAMDGWNRGRDILCNCADAMLANGEPPPPWLVQFLIWGTRDGTKARREGSKRISRAYETVDRDEGIARAVRYVNNLTGLKPTRNHSPSKPRNERRESACSIVAQALGLLGVGTNEPGVEKIWSDTKGAKKSLLHRPLARRALRTPSDHICPNPLRRGVLGYVRTDFSATSREDVTDGIRSVRERDPKRSKPG
jgi:hypothetical protein